MEKYINYAYNPFISYGRPDFPLRFLSFSVKWVQQRIYANFRDKEGISDETG